MNNKLERMSKKSALAYLEVLIRDLHEGSEESHETPQTGGRMPGLNPGHSKQESWREVQFDKYCQKSWHVIFMDTNPLC
jgi:hypothetical protein